jgi:hypothetical protein
MAPQVASSPPSFVGNITRSAGFIRLCQVAVFLSKYDLVPTHGPEKRKYGLARAVVDYVSTLAGFSIPLENLYVTNLCNEFLPSTQGKGTVLIPDAQAKQGVQEICAAIDRGHFKVIIPTSCQVFYHFCRLGFLDVGGKKFHHDGIPVVPVLHVKQWPLKPQAIR